MSTVISEGCRNLRAGIERASAMGVERTTVVRLVEALELDAPTLTRIEALLEAPLPETYEEALERITKRGPKHKEATLEARARKSAERGAARHARRYEVPFDKADEALIANVRHLLEQDVGLDLVNAFLVDMCLFFERLGGVQEYARKLVELACTHTHLVEQCKIVGKELDAVDRGWRANGATLGAKLLLLVQRGTLMERLHGIRRDSQEEQASQAEQVQRAAPYFGNEVLQHLATVVEAVADSGDEEWDASRVVMANYVREHMLPALRLPDDLVVDLETEVLIDLAYDIGLRWGSMAQVTKIVDAAVADSPDMWEGFMRKMVAAKRPDPYDDWLYQVVIVPNFAEQDEPS